MKVNMKQIVDKCVSGLKKLRLRDVVFIVVILALLGALASAARSCNDDKSRYENNIKALTDSIKYYKSKSGDMVGEKQGFVLEKIKELRQLNEDLYNEVQDMKNLVKPNDVTSATQFSGEIVNVLHDTTYVVQYDTIKNGFNHNFAFNDEWRDLEGNVNYADESLSMAITKDVTRFDYTVVTDKDNKVYIKSKNPYVKFDEFTGFTIPSKTQKRTKHFGVGPEIGVGVTTEGKVVPYAGVGVHWSLWQF